MECSPQNQPYSQMKTQVRRKIRRGDIGYVGRYRKFLPIYFQTVMGKGCRISFRKFISCMFFSIWQDKHANSAPEN